MIFYNFIFICYLITYIFLRNGEKYFKLITIYTQSLGFFGKISLYNIFSFIKLYFYLLIMNNYLSFQYITTYSYACPQVTLLHISQSKLDKQKIFIFCFCIILILLFHWLIIIVEQDQCTVLKNLELYIISYLNHT